MNGYKHTSNQILFHGYTWNVAKLLKILITFSHKCIVAGNPLRNEKLQCPKMKLEGRKILIKS
jgi:hypothetical protein